MLRAEREDCVRITAWKYGCMAEWQYARQYGRRPRWRLHTLVHNCVLVAEQHKMGAFCAGMAAGFHTTIPSPNPSIGATGS